MFLFLFYIFILKTQAALDAILFILRQFKTFYYFLVISFNKHFSNYIHTIVTLLITYLSILFLQNFKNMYILISQIFFLI